MDDFHQIFYAYYLWLSPLEAAVGHQTPIWVHQNAALGRCLVSVIASYSMQSEGTHNELNNRVFIRVLWPIVTRILSGIWLRLLPAMCKRRVSSQHMVKSLTWILMWAYLIWNFEPIFGLQISILDPPLTLDFLVYLGLNFHPMGEWGEGGSVGLATYFFVTDRQKRVYLSRASQRARGATKNQQSVLNL